MPQEELLNTVEMRAGTGVMLLWTTLCREGLLFVLLQRNRHMETLRAISVQTSSQRPPVWTVLVKTQQGTRNSGVLW